LMVFISAGGLGIAKELLPKLKDQLAEYGQGDMSALTVGDLRELLVFYLFLGLAVVASVLLHLRLLRWYFLVKKSDVS
jgi:hypothetical protein